MITHFFHNTFHNIRMNLDMREFVYDIFHNLPYQILHNWSNDEHNFFFSIFIAC